MPVKQFLPRFRAGIGSGSSTSTAKPVIMSVGTTMGLCEHHTLGIPTWCSIEGTLCRTFVYSRAPTEVSPTVKAYPEIPSPRTLSILTSEQPANPRTQTLISEILEVQCVAFNRFGVARNRTSAQTCLSSSETWEFRCNLSIVRDMSSFVTLVYRY